MGHRLLQGKKQRDKYSWNVYEGASLGHLLRVSYNFQVTSYADLLETKRDRHQNHEKSRISRENCGKGKGLTDSMHG